MVLKSNELKKITEILAFIKILIPSTNLKYYEAKYDPEYVKEYYNIRIKMLEWSGKLNVPVISGIIIGADTSENTKQTIDKVCEFQQNMETFIPFQFNQSPIEHWKTIQKIRWTYVKSHQYIKSTGIDFTLSTPIHTYDIGTFIDEGIRDLGSIPINPEILFPKTSAVDFNELETTIKKKGFELHQRLPIKYDYIKEGLYSKKLGQVFDSYKYKIKKYEQEKLKDIKANAWHK